MFYKNTPQNIYFTLINNTTGSGLTGATPVGFRTIATTPYSLTGGITEIASGQYVFGGVAGDFDGGDEIGYYFTAASAVPVNFTLKLEDALATSSQLVDASGGLNTTITNLNDFNPTTTPVAVSGTVTTDSASREASKANVSTLATYAQLVDVSGGLNTSIISLPSLSQIKEGVLVQGVGGLEASLNNDSLGTFLLTAFHSHASGNNIYVYRTDNTTLHTTIPISGQSGATPIVKVGA